MASREPYTIPEPKSSWDYFRYTIFEYNVLYEHSENIPKLERVNIFLKVYLFYIVPLTVVLYLLVLAVWIGIDIPSMFSSLFKEKFISDWNALDGFIDKYIFYVHSQWPGLEWSTVFGLGWGLAFGLVLGRVLGLVLGLVGLVLGFGWSLVSGLVLGLVFGLVRGLVRGLVLGLVLGLVTGFFEGIYAGISTGIYSGLITILGYSLGYSRLLFYPYRLFQMLKKNSSLKDNPYLYDSSILIPLPIQKLKEEAFLKPVEGLQFANFLFQYRPHNKDLAYLFVLKSICGNLENDPLNRDVFEITRFGDPDKKYRYCYPSSSWQSKFYTTRESLLNAEQESGDRLKKNAYKTFLKSLQELIDLTKAQDASGYEWKADITRALEKWKEETDSKISNLEQELQYTEKVCPNLFAKNCIGYR
jgi:gas vesicle protein